MLDFFLSEILGLFVFLPISLVFATPVILVVSFRGGEGYWKTVKKNYLTVINWWKKNL